MADTPTPTAQDWEALGMPLRGDSHRLGDPTCTEDDHDWLYVEHVTVEERGGDWWHVDFDHSRDAHTMHTWWRFDTEAEAFTICAALVLLAAGVLSAGAPT